METYKDKNGLTYTKVGDYWLPNLTIGEQPKRNYGKWGMMRRSYLENHRQVEYNRMKLTGELIPHLNEIDEQARDMWETLMEQLEKQRPAPPQGTMEWVQWMNGLRAIADEIVQNDIIYAI